MLWRRDVMCDEGRVFGRFWVLVMLLWGLELERYVFVEMFGKFERFFSREDWLWKFVVDCEMIMFLFWRMRLLWRMILWCCCCDVWRDVFCEGLGSWRGLLVGRNLLWKIVVDWEMIMFFFWRMRLLWRMILWL